jgi:hypothetical protein
VLRYMDRSAMHYMKQRGWTNQQIAAFTGHHRDTVARVLRESPEKEPARRQRRDGRPAGVGAAAFELQIQQWLDERLSVQRMIELARADTAHPFTGSDVAFYNFVRPLRKARQTLPAMAVVRFEGLPGELLQIDWGEQRQMPFSKPALVGQTRYFFAARLKYSRYMWVCFTHDMQSETLLRCLIACLVDLGGVHGRPAGVGVVTSDNPKTITLGRDAQHQPVLHPAYQKLAVEFRFHPVLCTHGRLRRRRGKSEGRRREFSEVRQGELPGRAETTEGRGFYDDADLAQECAAWMRRVNEERPSDATEQLPIALLAEERPRFQPLPRRRRRRPCRRLRDLRQCHGQPGELGDHRDQSLLRPGAVDRPGADRPAPCRAHRPLPGGGVGGEPSAAPWPGGAHRHPGALRAGVRPQAPGAHHALPRLARWPGRAGGRVRRRTVPEALRRDGVPAPTSWVPGRSMRWRGRRERRRSSQPSSVPWRRRRSARNMCAPSS